VKFFIDNIWLVALILISGGALALPSLQRRGTKVTVLQATQMMNGGKIALIDVRDATQFAAGHVRDAKNIPLKELAQRAGELDKFKAKPVIAMCQSGIQSSQATTQLKKAGFTEVYSLDGGVAAWRAQGLPVVK
jgi:rhodanese-related sulfurtransferase